MWQQPRGQARSFASGAGPKPPGRCAYKARLCHRVWTAVLRQALASPWCGTGWASTTQRPSACLSARRSSSSRRPATTSCATCSRPSCCAARSRGAPRRWRCERGGVGAFSVCRVRVGLAYPSQCACAGAPRCSSGCSGPAVCDACPCILCQPTAGWQRQRCGLYFWGEVCWQQPHQHFAAGMILPCARRRPAVLCVLDFFSWHCQLGFNLIWHAECVGRHCLVAALRMGLCLQEHCHAQPARLAQPAARCHAASCTYPSRGARPAGRQRAGT